VNCSLLLVYPVVRNERAASIRSALFLEILLHDGEHHFRNHLNAHIRPQFGGCTQVRKHIEPDALVRRFGQRKQAPVRLRDSDVARRSAGQAFHQGRSNCAQPCSGIPRTLTFERESEAAWAPRFETRNEARIMGSKRLLIIAAAAILALSWYSPLLSAQTGTSSTKQSDEAARAENAANVLSEIMEAPDQGIPEALLKKAYGIAVIPHVVKGAFGVGGRYGKGLVAQRNADGGWGTPLFIEIGGGSFGFQIGVQATDIVMVFTNRAGIQPLLKGKLKIGADASATAGPVGRNAEVGTDILLKSAIYSYSRSKGLFAGIALDGAVIQLDDDANKGVYGKESVAADLSKARVRGAAIAVVQPFLRALQKYAPAEVPKTTLKQ
jgi:lipid-binding SYLF domain-containing protein